MKKHPLSTACAYVMLGALIIFGIAGISLTYTEMLPPDWVWLTAYAQTAIVLSLGAAFVAASLASMRSAWHAERALQANNGRIMWLALGYTTFCIVIEVAIGKLGAAYIGAEVPTMALFALLTFFAIAPRLVAVILSGMDGIEREAAHEIDQGEKAHDLARLEIIEKAREARIQQGAVNLQAERDNRAKRATSAGLIGAAALLAGATATEAMIPSAHAFPTETVASNGGEESESDPVFKRSVWAKNLSKYDRAKELFAAQPNISAKRVARIVGVSKETVKQWRFRAQAELAIAANPVNATLLDRTA